MSVEFREARVTAEGSSIAYAEAGSGEAIVAIGKNLVPAPAHVLLAKDRRVILFAQDGAAPQLVARSIAASLAVLGLARFDLLGHGRGAETALWLALARPAEAGAVVLVGAMALAARGTELEQRLGELKRPVLALFGTNDRTAPPEEGGRYRALLPDCHLMFAYDAGHEVERERPEALAFITREFFERRDLFLVSRDSGLAFP